MTLRLNAGAHTDRPEFQNRIPTSPLKAPYLQASEKGMRDGLLGSKGGDFLCRSKLAAVFPKPVGEVLVETAK